MEITKKTDVLVQKPADKTGIPKVFLYTFLGILSVWLLSWLLLAIFSTPGNRGSFGDQFGAVNSLFSGFAFGGLIIALWYQKEELRMQREDSEEARKIQSDHLRILRQTADSYAQMSEAQTEQTQIMGKNARINAWRAILDNNTTELSYLTVRAKLPFEGNQFNDHERHVKELRQSQQKAITELTTFLTQSQ